MSKLWKRHKTQFKNCQNCELCETRDSTVLLRTVPKNRIPVDVLFIGSSPNFNDNALGLPFVGTSGRFLETIIQEVQEPYEQVLSYGFTNLIACINRDPENPSKTLTNIRAEYIKSCSERLQDLYSVCRPRAVVAVGKIATDRIPKILGVSTSASITHPAAILRLKEDFKWIEEKRVYIALSDLWQDLIENK